MSEVVINMEKSEIKKYRQHELEKTSQDESIKAKMLSDMQRIEKEWNFAFVSQEEEKKGEEHHQLVDIMLSPKELACVIQIQAMWRASSSYKAWMRTLPLIKAENGWKVRLISACSIDELSYVMRRKGLGIFAVQVQKEEMDGKLFYNRFIFNPAHDIEEEEEDSDENDIHNDRNTGGDMVSYKDHEKRVREDRFHVPFADEVDHWKFLRWLKTVRKGDVEVELPPAKWIQRTLRYFHFLDLKKQKTFTREGEEEDDEDEFEEEGWEGIENEELELFTGRGYGLTELQNRITNIMKDKVVDMSEHESLLHAYYQFY